MDKSKLPKMVKGKVIPIPGVVPMTYKKSKSKKRGGVGGVLDAISEKNRRLKEASEY